MITDTDINKVVQENRVYEPFPAQVHRYDTAKDAFTTKRCDTAAARDAALKAGWFATPLKAIEAATKKPAPMTPKEDDPLADRVDADATDDTGAPLKARK